MDFAGEIKFDKLKELKLELLCIQCKNFPGAKTNLFTCFSRKCVMCENCWNSTRAVGPCANCCDDGCPKMSTPTSTYLFDPWLTKFAKIFAGKPCVFSVHGCPKEFHFDDVKIHEKSCVFQAVRCPLESCQDTVIFKYFNDHFKRVHLDEDIKSDATVDKNTNIQDGNEDKGLMNPQDLEDDDDIELSSVELLGSDEFNENEFVNVEDIDSSSNDDTNRLRAGLRRRRRNNGNQSSTDNESLEISANDDSGNGSGDQTSPKTQHNAIPGKLCRKFFKFRNCKFGGGCLHSHHFNGRFCIDFIRNRCTLPPRLDKCRYPHLTFEQLQEKYEEIISNTDDPQVCPYFNHNGFCKFRKKCKFLHVRQEICENV